MYELNGLQNIVGSAVLGGIEEPPEAEDFTDPTEYERAYSDWWTRTNCWRVETRRTEGR